MGSQQAIVDAIVSAASGSGDVAARKMFGEYGLYCNGKLVALICDDRLFVKPTEAGRAMAGQVEELPPYDGAKPCLLIPPDQWQNGTRLSDLIRVTMEELPAPKAKRKVKRDGVKTERF